MKTIENSIIKCRGCEKMLIINQDDVKDFLLSSEKIIKKICEKCNNEEKLVIKKAFFYVDYALEDYKVQRSKKTEVCPPMDVIDSGTKHEFIKSK